MRSLSAPVGLHRESCRSARGLQPPAPFSRRGNRSRRPPRHRHDDPAPRRHPARARRLEPRPPALPGAPGPRPRASDDSCPQHGGHRAGAGTADRPPRAGAAAGRFNLRDRGPDRRRCRRPAPGPRPAGAAADGSPSDAFRRDRRRGPRAGRADRNTRTRRGNRCGADRLGASLRRGRPDVAAPPPGGGIGHRRPSRAAGSGRPRMEKRRGGTRLRDGGGDPSRGHAKSLQRRPGPAARRPDRHAPDRRPPPLRARDGG